LLHVLNYSLYSTQGKQFGTSAMPGGGHGAAGDPPVDMTGFSHFIGSPPHTFIQDTYAIKEFKFFGEELRKKFLIINFTNNQKVLHV